MPWNFCLFYKGEVEVRRENEPPSCKNSWVREFTAHGGWLEAGWTSGVLYRDSDGLRAQHKLVGRIGLLSDDRIRGPWEIKPQYTHYNSLGKCITSLWCFNFPHILSQFTSELGKHWICSQIEFINCSVCSYFKPGLANSYTNQARWGWGWGWLWWAVLFHFKSAAGNPTELLSVASRTPAQEQLVKKWKLPDWKGKGKLSLFAMPYYI